MAKGAANYVGDGGMMGAVTRGLGGLSNAIGGGNTAESIETPDSINLNPGMALILCVRSYVRLKVVSTYNKCILWVAYNALKANRIVTSRTI